MKNQVCPKPDCMYLHEIGECKPSAVVGVVIRVSLTQHFISTGDEAASFTKEEMQQGKHTDYERLLHEQLLSPCPIHKEGR